MCENNNLSWEEENSSIYIIPSENVDKLKEYIDRSDKE